MYSYNEPTTLAEIDTALDFAASFEGRAVRKVVDAGLRHELETFLSYLLTRVDEVERQTQAEESYW